MPRFGRPVNWRGREGAAGIVWNKVPVCFIIKLNDGMVGWRKSRGGGWLNGKFCLALEDRNLL